MTAVQPESDHPGLYGITVAARLVGTGVQNLRAYERRGLVRPARTPGGTRLYSDADIARLRRINQLLAEGLNLAGVAQVLDLEDRVADLQDTVDGLRADNSALEQDNARLRKAQTPPDASPASGGGRARR